MQEELATENACCKSQGSILDGFGSLLGGPWAALGLLWGDLGRVLSDFGCLLNAPEGLLGASWVHLCCHGRLWSRFWKVWGRFLKGPGSVFGIWVELFDAL